MVDRAEKESFFWRWIWDAPFVGEIIQTFFLFLPIAGIGFTGALKDVPDSPGLMLGFMLVEIAWLWGLERWGGKRLVVPIIPLPWLWVFIALAGYCLLAIAGFVDPM